MKSLLRAEKSKMSTIEEEEEKSSFIEAISNVNNNDIDNFLGGSAFTSNKFKSNSKKI